MATQIRNRIFGNLFLILLLLSIDCFIIYLQFFSPHPKFEDLVKLSGKIESIEEVDAFSEDIPIIYLRFKLIEHPYFFRYHRDNPKYSLLKRCLIPEGKVDVWVNASVLKKDVATTNVYQIKFGECFVNYEEMISYSRKLTPFGQVLSIFGLIVGGLVAILLPIWLIIDTFRILKRQKNLKIIS